MNCQRGKEGCEVEDGREEGKSRLEIKIFKNICYTHVHNKYYTKTNSENINPGSETNNPSSVLEGRSRHPTDCRITNNWFWPLFIIKATRLKKGAAKTKCSRISNDQHSRCKTGTGRSLNIRFFPRILESLPPLPRQHPAAIGCTKITSQQEWLYTRIVFRTS